jgi:hypothetical protein
VIDRQLADEIVVSKVESTNKINELENRIVKYQNDIVKSQKHQVSAEAKLKTQTSLYEQKSKNSKEKKSTLEQEFAASRFIVLVMFHCFELWSLIVCTLLLGLHAPDSSNKLIPQHVRWLFVSVSSNP